MRIAVLGASGRTGRRVVEVARARGHQVTVVVRTAARAPEAEEVRILPDGRDQGMLADALANVDALVFAIGPVPGDDDPVVMRECAAATIAAAARAGLTRAVFVSASGPYIDAGDDFFTGRIAKPIVQRILRREFEDLAATEVVVRASDLEWTLVRPPMLTEASPRGRYRRRVGLNVPRGTRIGRADLALAVMDALEDPALVRETLAVAR